ncbi:MAG: hypothetical protein U0905_13910 [Pirellulales bacterium]
MSPITLTIVFVVAFGVRLLFLGVHLSDPDRLWSDYERRGLRYRIAQGVDLVSFLMFAAPAFYSLYKIHSLESPLMTTFVSFLGLQLLGRLAIQKFPRTNSPGLFSEAKIDLFVQVLLSLLGGGVLTCLAAVYLWWSRS